MKLKKFLKHNQLANQLYRLLLKLRPATNSRQSALLTNFYHSNWPKQALLSYVSKPFLHDPYYYHTNSQEALIIGELLNQHGYNVDIIDCASTQPLNYKKYDLLFGFEAPYRRGLEEVSLTTKKIFYSTGMHPTFNNRQTIKRIKEFSQKIGSYALESARYLDLDHTSQIELSDATIGLGDSYVQEIYQQFSSTAFYLLPPSFYQICNFKDIINHKDFTVAKKNFLFFSGGGLVHKGLDLVLDYFSTQTDLTLHVCCSIINEAKFAKYYQTALHGRKNIKFYGFVDLKSAEFKDLLNLCGFIIFPSCAEGGGASVVNVMGNSGMIPLVTKESSIPINNFGLRITDLTVEAIKAAVEESQAITPNQLRTLSLQCGEFVATHNSLTNYRHNLDQLLQQVL